MATSCKADVVEKEASCVEVEASVAPQTENEHNKVIDFDFVEEPSQDFFCPVTLELLINPHQTLCCGNHLSQEAASRLNRDGKPCPTCKEPQLSTIPDKFFKRKVNEIKVRCPHKKSGCEWVGGVNEVKQHSDSCPKRPWQCQYCEFESTYDIGVNEHLPVCTKYPIVCPNSCEVGSVARCDLEAHLMECPLQPVTCEYAEVGCDVKVPRRDLDRHMKEGQQQHLLSATLLNLRLTKENKQKMDKIEQDLAAKDVKINELKQDLAAKDVKMDELKLQIEKNHKQLEHLALQGCTVHELTLNDFKKCQAKGGDGDWNSEWVYSHPTGYSFQLQVETNGAVDTRLKYMSIRVVVKHETSSSFLIISSVHIQLLNQLGDCDHHEKRGSAKSNGCWERLFPRFIQLSELGRNDEGTVQYLKDDRLRFRVRFKAEPAS